MIYLCCLNLLKMHENNHTLNLDVDAWFDFRSSKNAVTIKYKMVRIEIRKYSNLNQTMEIHCWQRMLLILLTKCNNFTFYLCCIWRNVTKWTNSSNKFKEFSATNFELGQKENHLANSSQNLQFSYTFVYFTSQ